MLILIIVIVLYFLVVTEMYQPRSKSKSCASCSHRIVTAQVYASPDQVSQGLAWN